jgi:hypothetical protein
MSAGCHRAASRADETVRNEQRDQQQNANPASDREISQMI